jgi:LPS export ABC transporter protein LptC
MIILRVKTVLLIVVTLLLCSCSKGKQGSAVNSESGSGVDQSVKAGSGGNIHIVETMKGETVHKTEIRKMTSYRYPERWNAEGIKIDFYKEGKPLFRILADNGDLFVEKDLTELWGNVGVEAYGYTLAADRAFYDQKSHMAGTNGIFVINGKYGRLSGKGLSINLEDESFKIGADVDTVININALLEEGAAK